MSYIKSKIEKVSLDYKFTLNRTITTVELECFMPEYGKIFKDSIPLDLSENSPFSRFLTKINQRETLEELRTTPSLSSSKVEEILKREIVGSWGEVIFRRDKTKNNMYFMVWIAPISQNN